MKRPGEVPEVPFYRETIAVFNELLPAQADTLQVLHAVQPMLHTSYQRLGYTEFSVLLYLLGQRCLIPGDIVLSAMLV